MSQNNWPSWLPLRKDLASLSPYGAPQLETPVRLNTNENPYSLDPSMQRHLLAGIERHLEQLNRYPDRDANALRSALARFINARSRTNFDLSNIWAANGSNEILQSIFLAFGSATALGFIPSYSMHPLIGKVANVEWVEGSRNADFSLDVAKAVAQISEIKPALTFITTPNNPTGSAITISEVKELAEATAGINGLLIVDEAYAEFSKEASATTLIENFPNVLVSRTMSKAFAFAGVRLGYLAADKAVIAALQLVRLPYHLSTLTQAAAEVALDFQGELLAEVSKLANEREMVSKALIEMGLKVTPSDANFILFSGFPQSSQDLWQKLLSEGVLIRDVGLPGYLRVTIGNEAENQLFLTALQKILKGAK